MSNVVCPYCFEEFKRSDVMFRCGNDECTKVKDEAMSDFWKVPMNLTPAIENNLGTFARLMNKMPNSAVCPECGRKAYETICPHCHNKIPKDMVEKKGYIISIIGARSSGKTNYITVLIDQLRRNGSKLGDIGILASSVAENRADCTQIRYQRDFYDVLFKNGTCPAQTRIEDRKSKIPLIYTIYQKGVQPTYLVFYDTAGENFHDPKNINKHVKFLDESDAVIFLLDTFSIEYVHEKLNIKDDIELPYNFILNNLIGHFDNADKDKAEAHYKKPMALVFSKIDAILQNADLFGDTSIAGMSIDQNSPYLSGGGVNINDIEGVSDSLQTALKSWGESNFVNTVNNKYKNHMYFGISSLGKSPDMNNQIKNIRPYRVLDPLVWILDQFGYPLRKNK